MTQPTFLLVHGAWHSSAQWAATVAALAHRGHAAVAIDLPGHGVHARFPGGYFEPGQPGLTGMPSEVAGVTLDQAAEAVVAAARGLTAAVLVAHSIGGVVATRAMQLAPRVFRRVVYVAAFLPTELGSAAEYLALPEASAAEDDGLYLGDPGALGAVRINPRSQDPQYLERLRNAYYTGVDPEPALAYLSTLTPDQPLSFLGSPTHVTRERWGAIPRSYVHTTGDKALPLPLQHLMVAQADALTPENLTRLGQLPSGHAPFASHPEELANLLIELA